MVNGTLCRTDTPMVNGRDAKYAMFRFTMGGWCCAPILPAAMARFYQVFASVSGLRDVVGGIESVVDTNLGMLRLEHAAGPLTLEIAINYIAQSPAVARLLPTLRNVKWAVFGVQVSEQQYIASSQAIQRPAIVKEPSFVLYDAITARL